MSLVNQRFMFGRDGSLMPIDDEGLALEEPPPRHSADDYPQRMDHRMSEMIERVARAICEADNHGWPDDDYNGRTQRRFYEKQARAAIAAMRSPTSAMCNVGWNSGSVDPETIWEEMVDEALR